MALPAYTVERIAGGSGDGGHRDLHVEPVGALKEPQDKEKASSKMAAAFLLFRTSERSGGRGCLNCSAAWGRSWQPTSFVSRENVDLNPDERGMRGAIEILRPVQEHRHSGR